MLYEFSICSGVVCMYFSQKVHLSLCSAAAIFGSVNSVDISDWHVVVVGTYPVN